MKTADQIGDGLFELGMDDQVHQLCRTTKYYSEGLSERETAKRGRERPAASNFTRLQRAHDAIQSAAGHLEEALGF